MLFCIDIGNSNIVFGCYKNNKLLNSFRCLTKVEQTVDEYGIKIIDIIKHFGYEVKNISAIIISSVVPALDKTFETLGIKYFNINPIFIAPGIKTGIKIKLDNPKQLGADLLAAGVGAVEKYGCPCIIIDMGTATTFSYINKDKEFLGGIILPGLLTSYANLIEKTAKLEATKIEIPKKLIGSDTINAIQSGMIYGTCSQIDGLISKIIEEQGKSKIIITGGISRYIYSSLKSDVIYDEELLIDGLNLIYQKNK